MRDEEGGEPCLVVTKRDETRRDGDYLTLTLTLTERASVRGVKRGYMRHFTDLLLLLQLLFL